MLKIRFLKKFIIRVLIKNLQYTNLLKIEHFIYYDLFYGIEGNLCKKNKVQIIYIKLKN